MKQHTLSSAIRAGALVSEQAFGAYLSNYGATCALGSAGVALALDPGNDASFYDQLLAVYPHLSVPTTCPVCKEDGGEDLGDVIVCLNDSHEWPREWIADFVEIWENEHLGFETLGNREVTACEPPALLLHQEAALSG